MITNDNIDEVFAVLKSEIRSLTPPVIERIYAKYKNPFYVLISTVLSARSKDAVTSAVSERLFTLINVPEDLSEFSIKTLEKILYPVGFYRAKARHIKLLAKKLISEYGGKVPDTIDELMKLPGVGRKTANLVITEVFDKYGICVDTHVHRITNRWGYVKTKTPFETEMVLRKKLPCKYWKIINRVLVTYGQNICSPVNPKCEICSLNKYCEYGIGKGDIR